MVCRIMKEVLLANLYRVRFKPDLKGRSETGSKSIIDIDYQEVQIIADTVESGMSTLTVWLLVNDYREVEDIPLVFISTVGTCIDKLKPLVENVQNKKQ